MLKRNLWSCLLFIFGLVLTRMAVSQTHPLSQTPVENLKSGISRQLTKGQSLPAPQILSSLAPQKTMEVVFSDDFETNTANWSFQGNLWQIGQPTSGPGFANGGTRCAATNLSGNYTDNAADGLLSRNIALPVLPHPRSALRLRFWTWYETESSYDRGGVWISTDNGQNWTNLRFYEGSLNVWAPAVIDLSAYAGSNIRLDFYFTSDGSVNYAGWYIDDVTIELTEVTSSNHVEIAVAPNGQFTMGIPVGPVLLFGHPYPWSSASTVQIDGQDFWNYRYQPWGTTISAPETNGLSNTGVWSFPGSVQVRQTLTIVQGSSTGNFDTGEIRYTVTNNDATAHQIGLRVMLDTMLGLNDGAPFRVPGAGAVTTEQEWDATRMPPYFQAFDDLINPTVQSQGTLVGGNALKPDRFVTSGWEHINDTPWEYATIPGRDYYTPGYGYDSAIGVYWLPVLLQPGETKEFVTYYGLGGIDVDIQPPLVAGLSAPTGLVFLNGTSNSNPFTLAVYLSNSSPGVTQTAVGVTTTLNLPAGLALPSGETAVHAIPNMPIGAEQNTAYRITALAGNSGRKTYSLTVAASNITTKTVQKSIHLIGITTSPTQDATLNPAQRNITAEFDLSMNPATISGNTFRVFDETGNALSASVTYDAVQRKVNLALVDNLTPNKRYKARLSSTIQTAEGIPLPHDVEWDFKVGDEPWPRTEESLLVFKIAGPNTRDIRKVVLTGNLNWTPLRKSSGVVFRIAKEVSASGYVDFTVADLSALNNPGPFNNEIWRIELVNDAENALYGHMGFHYTFSEYDERKKIDAILYHHSDLQSLRYEGWDYYATPEERPVSMLIPPDGLVSRINVTKRPLLFVHGVTGTYPYWGPMAADSQILAQYDGWQFYYPYDGHIAVSGKLLEGALKQLLKTDGITGAGQYQFRRVNVVAHSMGGLVTRSFIQSPDYNEEINKLLMLGTPNHGAYINYRLFYEHLGDEILGKAYDDQAPAYQEMTVGSSFLYGLNSETVKPLYRNADQTKSYLVVAGTEDFSMLIPHDEIHSQDDGVVAVSSASLLDDNIPLATREFEHRAFKENSREMILEFLREDFDPAGPAAGVFDNFWKTRENIPENVGKIEEDKGIWTLKTNGTKAKRFLIFPHWTRQRELILQADGSGNALLGHNYLQRLDDVSSCFSLNTSGLNEIGLGFKEATYSLKFQKWFWGSYWRPVAKRPDYFSFRHMQTTMSSVDFTPGELNLLNSTNFILPPSPMAKVNASVEMEWLVDASITSAVFFLVDEGNSGQPYNLQLISPVGNVLDSLSARGRLDLEFKQDVAEGVTYFFVRNPQPGLWKTRYDARTGKERLSAHVISGLDIAIATPDSEFTNNSLVPFEILVPQPDNFTNIKIAATLSHSESGEGESTNLGEVNLSASESGAKYLGQFSASRAGVYHVLVNFSGSHQGQTISRSTVRMVGIDYSQSTPSTGGRLIKENIYFYPNPFDPENQVGTMRFSLAKDGEVSIKIYDIANQLVKTMQVGARAALTELFMPWDGRNDKGEIVANGVYFYVIVSSSGERAVGKVAVLR